MRIHRDCRSLHIRSNAHPIYVMYIPLNVQKNPLRRGNEYKEESFFLVGRHATNDAIWIKSKIVEILLNSILQFTGASRSGHAPINGSIPLLSRRALHIGQSTICISDFIQIRITYVRHTHMCYMGF